MNPTITLDNNTQKEYSDQKKEREELGMTQEEIIKAEEIIKSTTASLANGLEESFVKAAEKVPAFVPLYMQKVNELRACLDYGYSLAINYRARHIPVEIFRKDRKELLKGIKRDVLDKHLL